jgi:methionine synthase I (cobalamin-dependent)
MVHKKYIMIFLSTIIVMIGGCGGSDSEHVEYNVETEIEEAKK